MNYWMGPEHTVPAAVDDTMSALQWLVDNAAQLRVDPPRIAVGGDSAGENLVAVASLISRDSGGPELALQLLIYPATDQRAQHDSHQGNGDGYLLTRAAMHLFRDQYHADPAEYLDRRASPLLAQSQHNLPPAFLLTAGFDPLELRRDDLLVVCTGGGGGYGPVSARDGRLVEQDKLQGLMGP